MRNILLLLCLMALPLTQAITAKVISCPAWTLNKHKELRLFLKGEKTGNTRGEIDEYAGVEIEWKRGKKAIMTIFDEDGQMMEEVELYKLETREEMHKLMADKGFLKKTKAQKVAEIQLARMEQRVGGGKPGSSSFTGTMGALYVMVTVVLAGFSYVTFSKRRRKKSKCAGPVWRH